MAQTYDVPEGLAGPLYDPREWSDDVLRRALAQARHAARVAWQPGMADGYTALANWYHQELERRVQAR